jgi:hypothetical protein
MFGKYDATLRDHAKMEDAKAYQAKLNEAAKAYGIEVDIGNKIEFPENVEVRLKGPKIPSGAAPIELPPVEYEIFKDLCESLQRQLGPHLQDPKSEMYIQKAIKKSNTAV